MATKKSRSTPLMSHEERRALINKPFKAVAIHERSTPWGGVYIRDTVPTEGRRLWKETPEDEEWMVNKWEEK